MLQGSKFLGPLVVLFQHLDFDAGVLLATTSSKSFIGIYLGCPTLPACTTAGKTAR
ncbi:MAG TPA: hypothetical protein VJ792_01100 [Candidatus Nitrosotalea sp.]|nr:hypothetical protein [Candidatus Nitrosotalea sp.]